VDVEAALRIVGWIVALAVCLGGTPAAAAGFRFIALPAGARGPAITGAIWYPCAAAPAAIAVGRIVVQGAMDCPIGDAKLPLVVISHGRGGSFVGHRDTAARLADAGFVVAAINHPGDTSRDLSRSGDISVFVERPADITRLIDFMLDASPAAHAIDRDRIGFFGFSRGGYTGLVLIGAEIDWAKAEALCRRSAERLCEQPLAHDARIRAAVIADPLAKFLAPASLAAIKVPVQLWASELGGDGVDRAMVALVDANLRATHSYRVVAKAGHFAFLTPCPAAVAAELPMLCRDAPDFDRAAFHQEFNGAVLAFFRAYLLGIEPR